METSVEGLLMRGREKKSHLYSVHREQEMKEKIKKPKEKKREKTVFVCLSLQCSLGV